MLAAVAFTVKATGYLFRDMSPVSKFRKIQFLRSRRFPRFPCEMFAEQLGKECSAVVFLIYSIQGDRC